MTRVKVNDLHLDYERLGAADRPAILLIMGFVMQQIAWPDPFCRRLADAGYQVIRFDNRDIGLSDRLPHLGRPKVARLVLRRSMGLPVTAPYSLRDMAADAVGLMDALDVRHAHVVGASMGGMIAQWMAIDFDSRVSSLVSMMSSDGCYRHAWPHPRLLKLVLNQPGPTLESRIEYGLKFWKAVGSPGDPPGDNELRRLITEYYRRDSDLSGRGRQLAAIIAERSRVARLKRLKLPSMIIHGDADPLILPAAGRATAAAIPGSRLEMIAGMGHDLRPAYIDRLADLIIEHTANVDS